jgi:acetolactate synthase-1/2/3 large subunit
MANNGYMTMQYTQDNHFGREAASGPQSGVSCPNFTAVAAAFGIPAYSI